MYDSPGKFLRKQHVFVIEMQPFDAAVVTDAELGSDCRTLVIGALHWPQRPAPGGCCIAIVEIRREHGCRKGQSTVNNHHELTVVEVHRWWCCTLDNC
jgi:hypothetical protein